MARNREWFLIGLICGVSVTAAIAVGLMTLDFHRPFVESLREWQTLATGMVALISVIIPVFWVQLQIDQSRAQEADRRERQHYAARATMPVALSEIIEYAEQALIALKAVPSPAEGRLLIDMPVTWSTPALPNIPSNAIEVLKTCIESAEHGSRAQIAKLLEHLQICNSRLHGLFNDEIASDHKSVTSHNMHAYFADFLELQLRCDRMFKYARRERMEIDYRPALQDLSTHAIFLDLEHYPGFQDALKKRYPE